ncbi:MAG: hypothetical protein QOF89_1463 [Acidobacteriota bacterium]|jgi:hypothetical protein|nr:hypothetical protein [Acidobacteriota bacterium]
MKKQMKKLVLSRETVRNLVEAELAPVAGGWTTSCASVEVICKHAPTQTGC